MYASVVASSHIHETGKVCTVQTLLYLGFRVCWFRNPKNPGRMGSLVTLSKVESLWWNRLGASQP